MKIINSILPVLLPLLLLAQAPSPNAESGIESDPQETQALIDHSPVDNILIRFNEESPREQGCSKQLFYREACIINLQMECGGSSFKFHFDIHDISRIYLEKADLEDEHETLFFECLNGKNCIKSDNSNIPAQPVFPVKLPEDKESTLGSEAVKAFEEEINLCNQ